MASEIKVDNIKDQCGTAVITKCGATHTVTAEVYKADTIQDTSGNAYLAKCGTTVTLGGCGQTIELASGASQTGFGRTGTVDWDTTAKTASFTAVSGNGYFINTTSGAITVTLPATPSAGNIVSVSDYNGTASTNAITLARNGSNINGDASDYTITKADSAVTFVYVDGTVGWTSVQTSNTVDNQNLFIVASGGTITECGDYKIHTFTGPGTFTVAAGSDTSNNEVSYLVVGGGGAGGTGSEGNSSVGSGGGGAGGFRERRAANDSYTVSPLNGATPITVTSQGYPIVVGGGGPGRASAGPCTGNNPNGSPSIFSSITSAGGGYGISRNGDAPQIGGSGGSGGGTTFTGSACSTAGGSGNTPPTSPAQGTNGGDGSGANPQHPGGGGGGATVSGGNALSHPAPGEGAEGGNGATTHITGSPVTYAGGGGGGVGLPGGPPGPGGSGGGGAGGTNLNPNGDGTAGTNNTGGGGGGAASGALMGACVSLKGGNGGSGVVIIRYKFQ